MKKIHDGTQYFGRDLEAMSFAKNYYRWILKEFKDYFGKTTADIGAGTGNFTELVVEHVNHLVAFEPSNNMYPLLKNRFIQNQKIKVIHGMLDEKINEFQEIFDSIIYVNVLEHVENDQKELLNVYKNLVYGGYALIFVPAFSFLYSDFDKKLGHFRRYNKQDFKKLARFTGFDIKKIKYIDFAGILPWYIFFVLLRNQLTAKKVSFYDRMAIPFIQQIERIITPPAGKNLLVIMQKTIKYNI